MKYQFQIDGRAFGYRVRATWEEAAQDAVSAGYASWVDGGDAVNINDQAEIVRIADDTPNPQ